MRADSDGSALAVTTQSSVFFADAGVCDDLEIGHSNSCLRLIALGFAMTLLCAGACLRDVGWIRRV